MFKFACIFLSALALQATLADPVQNQQERNLVAQHYLQQVRTAGNDAEGSVQNLQVGNQQVRRLLISEAHELAHQVHEAAYHLQQVVNINQNGQEQQDLQQVVSSLNDIVHSLQQALHQEPKQLQSQLKTQLQNIVAQAEKLSSVAQEQQQSQDVIHDILIVLNDLVIALEQVHARNRLQNQSQQEIKSRIQAVVNEASDAIQNVTSNNANVSLHLAHLSHHLAYHLGEVVHPLQREVHHQLGESLNVLRQVLNKLSEVKVSLAQVQENASANDLRNQLKTNIHSIGAQIERLIQLANSDGLSEQESRNLSDVVHNVLAHAVAAARQLQRNLQSLSASNQEN